MGGRGWRLLLSMKGLGHVELAETSQNRANHRRVGNGLKATRLGGERDFSTPLPPSPKTGYGATGRSAQNDNRQTRGLSRCPAWPGVGQRNWLGSLPPRLSGTGRSGYNAPPCK